MFDFCFVLIWISWKFIFFGGKIGKQRCHESNYTSKRPFWRNPPTTHDLKKLPEGTIHNFYNCYQPHPPKKKMVATCFHQGGFSPTSPPSQTIVPVPWTTRQHVPTHWWWSCKGSHSAPPQASREEKKHTVPSLSSWWFQPISKILVKLDHFPK